MPDRDPYKVLQVDREADPDVITAAYRALARRLHPDLDVSGVAAVRMAELNRAYALLRDPLKRREHDQRQLQPMGPGQDATAAPEAAAPRPERGRFDRREDPGGDMVIDFGRYAGWTLRQLARHDPDYLRWLSRHSSGIRYRRVILEMLGDRPAKPFVTSREQ